MRLLLLIFNLMFALVLDGQTGQCEVWQYTGTDSANRTLAKTQRFDSQGKVIYEKSVGFKAELLYYEDESEYFYVYNDTLLMSTTLATPELDSYRVEHRYDSTGKLVQLLEYKRRYVLPDTVQSGMFTINMVLTDSTDGKWVLRSDWSYTYDRWGRKSMIEITYPGYPTKNFYKWEYDGKGRTSKYECTMMGRPCYMEVFEYFDGGYRFRRTSYDEDGKVVSKPGRKDPPYMRAQIYTYKLDAQGRVIESRTEDRKGRLIGRMVTSYKAEGKIAREVCYGADDKQALTHVYVCR